MSARRKVTRRSVLQLAGSMAASAALAACTAPIPQAGGEDAQAGAAAPVSLDIWVFPLTDSDEDRLWAPLTEKLNEQHPNLEANIELLPWGGRREKMMTAFAAGQAPDIAYVNTDTISLFGTRGVLAPLDELIPDEIWADYPETVANGISWDGQRLMIPTLFIVTGHVANNALLEEIGWDPENPPHTWEDLRTAGNMAAQRDYFLTDWTTPNWGGKPAGLSSIWRRQRAC